MVKSLSKLIPTQRERRQIALVTLLFILVSAVLHMIIGGAIRPFNMGAVPQPSVTQILISKLETPPPTPPPTPRPSPTPPPQRNQSTPIPSSKASASSHASARPILPITLPSPTAASDGSQEGLGPPTPQAELPTAPTPGAAPSPIDARDIIVSARFIRRVKADYPEIAIMSRWEGTVIILLTIGPDGPSNVRIEQSSGYGALDQAALRAAKESTYSVPEVNGQPATETYRIIYTFSIEP